MYLSNNDIERSTLRQGDLLLNVHNIGTIDYKKIIYGRDYSDNIVSWGFTDKPLMVPAIILSYCCEISRENNGKVRSILLAPISTIKRAHGFKMTDIEIANDIEAEEHTYYKFFFFKPHLALQGYDSGFLIDFSDIFSVKEKSYDILLEKKVAQLDDETREQLSLKTALFFSR